MISEEKCRAAYDLMRPVRPDWPSFAEMMRSPLLARMLMMLADHPEAAERMIDKRRNIAWRIGDEMPALPAGDSEALTKSDSAARRPTRTPVVPYKNRALPPERDDD